MLMGAAQLMPVTHEEMLTVRREGYAMWLGEGSVLQHTRHLPCPRIYDGNPVGGQASHENPTSVTGEDRLERAIRQRDRAGEPRFPGIGEVEDHQLVGQLRGNGQPPTIG